MLVFVPKETEDGERRAPMAPETAASLVKKGVELAVESGLGQACGFADADYAKVGAQVSDNRTEWLARADAVIRLNKPPLDEISRMKKGAVHIGYMDPFFDPKPVDEMARCGISCIAMEMIPRTTLAQKMDALSSQANLAGYYAVVLAAERFGGILPMMMTPAGTIKPAHVFVIGVGVAGLQAIATAKRLGARVSAFDTRPAVEEQVQSLGAKFVKADLGQTGETKDGYALELTEEQKAKQREAMAKVVAQADIVITAAQVFGRKAPVIVTEEMVRSMRPGSVVVDLAAETGGNVAGVRAGEEKDVGGVLVIGARNFAGQVPVHASQMYSANVGNLIEHFWDKEAKTLRLDVDDAIMGGCLIVHGGELRNEMLKKARN